MRNNIKITILELKEKKGLNEKNGEKHKNMEKKYINTFSFQPKIWSFGDRKRNLTEFPKRG